MNGSEIERHLRIAKREVETVLTSLHGNVEPIHCVAEGMLKTGLFALDETLGFTLAGDGKAGHHRFSLGQNHEICERCLLHLKATEGVNSPCDGVDLSERELQIAMVARERGFSIGTNAAAKAVGAIYDDYKRNPGVTSSALHTAMKRIGDLKP